MSDERWTLAHEDCIEHMARMPDGFVDFAVFSPPLPPPKPSEGEG